MNYKRSKVPGGQFFFTVVTHRRKPIFNDKNNIEILRNAFGKVRQKHPFKVEAVVVMPDHLHCIWKLPEGDIDYPIRWSLIKGYFSKNAGPSLKQIQSTSRSRKREQAVWQRRFWEHTIKDEEDLIRHVEYIHYNPVKHGLVSAPRDWEYSSFHKFVAAGFYPQSWGGGGFILDELETGME